MNSKDSFDLGCAWCAAQIASCDDLRRVGERIVCPNCGKPNTIEYDQEDNDDPSSECYFCLHRVIEQRKHGHATMELI